MLTTRREFLPSLLLPFFAGSAARAQLPTQKPDLLKLPARAVTSGKQHAWFGYYDKCPWDETGRYLLAQKATFCDRQPTAKDEIELGMVDLREQDRWISLAKTRAWCWQQGTMLQWIGNAADREIIYNSLDQDEPVSIIQDVKSGKSRTLPRPIYALDAQGVNAVSLDFARLHRLRPGYGYASYQESHADVAAPKELGIWSFALTNPQPKLIITLAQLAEFQPDDRFRDAHHWVNHLQFNTTGSRFVFLHRWKVGNNRWFTRIFTAKPDGSDLKLHLDTGMVSHFDWRDAKTILAWVKTPREGNAFVLINTETNALELVGKNTLTQDGHCSYSPDRKWILNDTYPDAERLQTLMLYHVQSGRRFDLNRFSSPKSFTGPFRCDLHPRWNRNGTQVCFDGCHDDFRQVYVVDVREVVAG